MMFLLKAKLSTKLVLFEETGQDLQKVMNEQVLPTVYGFS